MARSSFSIDLVANDHSHLNQNQQRRLDKLIDRFDERFGEEYLLEKGAQFESFGALKAHFQEAKAELKLARQEKKLEEIRERIADKLGDEYDAEFLEGFETLQTLRTEWREVKQELREQKKQDKEKQEQPENPVHFDADANLYTVDVGVSAQDLNLLIANADAGATIILSNGTHAFTQTLLIERDDITLKGESEAGTILNFTFAEGTGGNAVEVTGGERTALTSLTETASAGSTEITLDDVSGISEGDVIYISQPNTIDYLLENGWTNVSFEEADARPFREMLVRVGSIEGNTLTLNSPLAFDFESGVTKIASTDLLENVRLSDFTVTSGIEDIPNYNDFVNDVPEFENTSVIMVNGADGFEIEAISILDAPSSGFDFRSTIDLVGNDLYVNGAHNLGGGGNGYGVNLYETFDATLTDLEIFNTRHGVLFSSWNAEAGNTVEVTQTNRDINFHGSPDMNNEVTVLRSVLEYDPEQDTSGGNGFWDIVSLGGSNHAATDIYADNSVTFSHAVGSQGTEIIYGAEGGAYLDGQGSQDVIYGGSGDDMIIGGTSQDVLTGGEGADLFIFRLGDAYDAIMDFSGNVDGDRILIQNDEIANYDDLILTQTGEDAYVRYGANSTIILSDTDVDSLEAEYFLFNTDIAMA